MTEIGISQNPVLFENQLLAFNTAKMPGFVNNSVSNLIKADNLSMANISSGEIPAVRAGLVSKLSNSSTNMIRGARNFTSSAVNSTISTTKEFGNVMANEVLPKPEPLSTTLMRNKFLSAVFVGGFINGIRGVSKVIKGETDNEQAFHSVIKETALGAIGGLSLAGGMGATASVFGNLMGKVPLSIAGLAVGTIAAIGVTELVKATIPAFGD
jgi:hypothetical protein